MYCNLLSQFAAIWCSEYDVSQEIHRLLAYVLALSLKVYSSLRASVSYCQ